MSSYHPASEAIFEFIDKHKLASEDMFPILRVFIASEYDRDPSILDRLKNWLIEMEDSLSEIE